MQQIFKTLTNKSLTSSLKFTGLLFSYIINHYKTLNLSKSATKQEVKSKYKKLAKMYHPDNPRTGNKLKFQEIHDAYENIMQGKG